jgi:hypothetical protein
MKARIIAAIIVTAVVCFLVCRKCHNGNSDEVVNYWKNKADDVVASLRMKEVELSMVERKYLDSIALIYKTKPKFIKQVVTVVQKGEVELKPDSFVVVVHDTVKAGCPPVAKSMRQTFSNPYYKASATVGEGAKLILRTFDTLTLVHGWVSTGLFRSKLQVDVSNTNPYSMITGIRSVSVPERKRPYGLGFQVGYNGKVYVGVGLSYNLIRL